MNSWKELFENLDDSVNKINVSPSTYLIARVDKLADDLKDCGEEAKLKFREMVNGATNAVAAFARGELDEKYLDIALERYRAAMENYADAAKIEAAKKTSRAFSEILGTVIKLVAGMLVHSA